MSESVVDEPFACPNCGKSSDEHPTMNVSDAKTIFLCQDRAAKWQRVEPGTVIPAGQPYREEGAEGYAREYPCSAQDRYVPPSFEDSQFPRYFVDSSWKPPLVLPTERSLILAEVDDRFTEDKVLLFGPHATKGNTWWSFDGRLSLIPDDINSFEVLWTENAP